MKCACCGKECYNDKYPEVVFKDAISVICEECSIDYEEIDGQIRKREDVWLWVKEWLSVFIVEI